MTAVTVIETERIEPGIVAETPARDMSRGGLGCSAALHLGAILLVVLGLPNLFRHPPPEDTPIAVSLVNIAPETRATHHNPYRPRPDAKPEPPIAAPAPKPEPKPEPPKPVPEPPSTASAPPPPPAPEQPKAETKPPPPAPPPPPPKPVEAQAPPLPPLPRPPEPKPKPEIRQAHHRQPAPPKPDATAFNNLLKALAPPPTTTEKVAHKTERTHPEPAEFDALMQNLTRDNAAEADDAPPAPHRMAATAPPSSQPRAPLGSQLSASDIDLVREKLRPCFNPPFGAKEKPDLAAEIRVVMNRDGTVQQARVVDAGQYAGDQIYRALADAGMRALHNPQCSPLPLPADRYDMWQTIVFPFSIRDMQ